MQYLKIFTLLNIFCVANIFADKEDSVFYARVNDLISGSEKMYNLSHEKEPKFLCSMNLNDFVLEYNIAKLNDISPIEMYFDEDVKKWITFYLKEKPNLTKKIIELSAFYFPLFEKELDRHGLPLELKYIPIIESSLNPNARSRSGAVGLWQFLYDTGKLLNLHVTSYVDERKDPYKATKAACEYFAYLYALFDDWLLAIAAYNGGPTTVKKAIIRAGGEKSFFAIRDFLSEETKNYVPKFVAANYVMNFYRDFGIVPDNNNILTYFSVDTIMTSKPVNFYIVSKYTSVPINVLSFLNPAYSKLYKPSTEKPEKVVLPREAVENFIKNSNNIYAESVVTKTSKILSKKVKIVHTVKKGEYLHLLSIKYKVPVEKIRKWNNLQTDMLFTNQKLLIWVEETVLQSNNFGNK